jgi:hypothetical protein
VPGHSNRPANGHGNPDYTSEYPREKEAGYGQDYPDEEHKKSQFPFNP